MCHLSLIVGYLLDTICCTLPFARLLWLDHDSQRIVREGERKEGVRKREGFLILQLDATHHDVKVICERNADFAFECSRHTWWFTMIKVQSTWNLFYLYLLFSPEFLFNAFFSQLPSSSSGLHCRIQINWVPKPVISLADSFHIRVDIIQKHLKCQWSQL